MGEFGRTPKFNKDGGRDHWAPAGSLLITGAPDNRIGASGWAGPALAFGFMVRGD